MVYVDTVSYNVASGNSVHNSTLSRGKQNGCTVDDTLSPRLMCRDTSSASVKQNGKWANTGKIHLFYHLMTTVEDSSSILQANTVEDNRKLHKFVQRTKIGGSLLTDKRHSMSGIQANKLAKS